MSKPKNSFDYNHLTSQNIEVNGANLHYIEEGKGDPIVFLHGIPTWSYIWRNIIPSMAKIGRCIAPDLIGMGKSAKPDIQYTIFEHIDYIEAFISALNLKNITFVLHGWGSLIGFEYARRHPDNVKGIAFLESHLRPVIEKDMIALPVTERAMVLENDEASKDVILNSNYYVNKVMPAHVIRKLTDEEMSAYQEPFNLPGSTQPIWQYLQDLPMSDEKTPVTELIATYSQFLEKSDIPKLLLYAMPGFNTSIETVMWAKENLPNLAVIEIEDALHYAQESHPQQLASALIDWYKTL